MLDTPDPIAYHEHSLAHVDLQQSTKVLNLGVPLALLLVTGDGIDVGWARRLSGGGLGLVRGCVLVTLLDPHW